MGADKSLARTGRKQTNVSVRMAWISFGALPCRKKKWWQLASRCCWNHARPWHVLNLFPSWSGEGLISTPVQCRKVALSGYKKKVFYGKKTVFKRNKKSRQCFSLHKDATPPQPNHTVTPAHIEPEQYNTWNKSTISRKLLKMDVLTFEICWAVNGEIIKQVTSSWSIFIQLSRWCTTQ